MARPDPKIFIVWSTKYKYIAEQLAEKLIAKRRDDFPVYPVMFNIGEKIHSNDNMHSSLIDAMNSADFAIVLMTPDEEVLRRVDRSLLGGFYATSRPNVYFEYGYLSSRIGERRIFAYSLDGQFSPTDTASLIMNQASIPTDFNGVMDLPNRIADEVERIFKKEKSYYYTNLNNDKYTINYRDVFFNNEFERDSYRFVINNSINLGNFWKYELNKFPKDMYDIGRKMIYILERIPFNVYLYESNNNEDANEPRHVFVDTNIINQLAEELRRFSSNITDPLHFRNYRMYQATLDLIRVIENYQKKRNQATAFSCASTNKYRHEAHKMLTIEEYMPIFPLNLMLYTRYTALCMHKTAMSLFYIDSTKGSKGYKKDINDYLKERKGNDELVLASMYLSNAIILIKKTIEYAQEYDSVNTVELHKSLALFDLARMEYVYGILMSHFENKKRKCDYSTENYPKSIEYINDYVFRKVRSKIQKSVDYALIEYFDELSRPPYDIEVNMDAISSLSALLTEEILNKMDDLEQCHSNNYGNLIKNSFDWQEDFSSEAKSNTEETKSNTESHQLEEEKCTTDNDELEINRIKKQWKDCELDIHFISKTSYLNIVSGQGVESIDKSIVNKVKERMFVKLGKNVFSKMDDFDIIINYDGVAGSEDRDATKFKRRVNQLVEEVYDKLEKEYTSTAKDYCRVKNTWLTTINRANELRDDNWKNSSGWPPNMKSILKFEHLHCESERYIYELFDGSCQSDDEENSSSKAGQKGDEKSKNASDTEKEHLSKVKQETEERSKIARNKLHELRDVLNHSKSIIQDNYDLPDLFNNLIDKIDSALTCYNKKHKNTFQLDRLNELYEQLKIRMNDDKSAQEQEEKINTLIDRIKESVEKVDK